MRPGIRRALVWALVAAATVVGGRLVEDAGVPSGYLFAALLAGLAVALLAPGTLSVPLAGFRVGQAVTGVALGTFVQTSTLTGLGARWVPVILVSAATLVVTVAAGLTLARLTSLDRPTASLGMIAGGASGIVAMAGELGADERLVAFMQYMRVLIVTLLTPLLVPIAFGADAGGAPGGQGPLLGSAAGWALTAGAAVAGAALGPRLRLPAPFLLGPLILTAVLATAGATGDAEVPPLAREIAFALIGLYVGLGFEMQTVRRIARLAVPVVIAVGALLVACFALGWLLELAAGVSLLDGYLATTPGGLFAILPIAYGSGADTTFVLAVQGLRLIVMVLAAPAMVRWMLAQAGGPAQAGPPHPGDDRPRELGA